MTHLLPTLAVRTHPAATLDVGVPCAARPGTSFRHLDGGCQCFFGGTPPQLVAPPYPHVATSGQGHRASRTARVRRWLVRPGRRR